MKVKVRTIMMIRVKRMKKRRKVEVVKFTKLILLLRMELPICLLSVNKCKMMDMLCNRHIDQPEEHEKPLNEKRIRQSIDGIVKDEFLSNRTLCLSIVDSLNKPQHVFKDAVSALKFLIYAQRLLLFCP